MSKKKTKKNMKIEKEENNINKDNIENINIENENNKQIASEIVNNQQYIVLISIPSEYYLDYKIFNNELEAKKFFIQVFKSNTHLPPQEWDLDEVINLDDNSCWNVKYYNFHLTLKPLIG